MFGILSLKLKKSSYILVLFSINNIYFIIRHIKKHSTIIKYTWKSFCLIPLLIQAFEKSSLVQFKLNYSSSNIVQITDFREFLHQYFKEKYENFTKF